MRKKLYQRAVRWTFAAACLCAMVDAAGAATFTRGCAARDMQLLMLIEARESANDISPEMLNDAMLSMMHARMVCHEGHVTDALALYDSVTQSLSASTVLSGR